MLDDVGREKGDHQNPRDTKLFMESVGRLDAALSRAVYELFHAAPGVGRVTDAACKALEWSGDGRLWFGLWAVAIGWNRRELGGGGCFELAHDGRHPCLVASRAARQAIARGSGAARRTAPSVCCMPTMARAVPVRARPAPTAAHWAVPVCAAAPAAHMAAAGDEGA